MTAQLQTLRCGLSLSSAQVGRTTWMRIVFCCLSIRQRLPFVLDPKEIAVQQELAPGQIVCAIDVHDFDQNLVDLAATIARQEDSNLNLLFVTLSPDPTRAAWPAYVGSPKNVIQDYRRFKEISTNIPDVPVRYHHLLGTPSEKILEFLDRNRPRLLIIGTHGRRGLARIFGSVAATVMRDASCPVLVLRQPG